jgi:N-acetylated-alpha-linked acidic dipeptidase
MTRALAAGPLRRETADAVNRELLAFERTWLHEPGIPGRAWFKHLLYAPRYTYAAMSLPGVTEAAEAGDWTRAQAQLALLVAKADENTARVTRAAELLDRSPRK